MTEEKRTVLIVDDDQSILRVFTRVLEKKGYAVTTVENGKSSLKQIERRRFDAALIDMRLPDIEGTELLPVLQQKSPGTIRIVFTGSPNMQSLANGKRNDMDAFLIKPVNPEVLLRILNEKLKKK
ncbi:MAG: response regulator [Candidatus Bathyarchaeota archaeon]|nr:response regulator [Candidatus Bathyarchaeota archaeon]